MAGTTNREERPVILLTASDCERLSALLDSVAENDSAAERFLRDAIARAEVVRGQPVATSLVIMGSEVKFIDHRDGHVGL